MNTNLSEVSESAPPLPVRSAGPAITQAALELLSYCRAKDWAGFDPYDGLTSPLFERFPLLQHWSVRLVFIQFMKRSSVNFRPLAGIAPDQNPKGLAVFSSSLIKLLRAGILHDPEPAASVVAQLLRKKTRWQAYEGWGYNFDWQTRSGLVPKHTPNIICTSFAGNALLDAYEYFEDASCLEGARTAGMFLVNGLNISEHAEGICFSYTPLDRQRIHNANLLGAAFLARLYRAVKEPPLLNYAVQAARYSAAQQLPDGSWPYGEKRIQKWIDNFHTGYNLTALADFSLHAGNEEFLGNIERGFAFYRKHFFEAGCLAKYYHTRLYPIDIHSIAQSIITLIRLKELDPDAVPLARDVCAWALANMRDRQGFFYYQKTKWYTNRISYMRWSQAWMLLALATLLENEGGRKAVAAEGRPVQSRSKKECARRNGKR